ncbi:MAG: ABC transporter substrate-binding protein, partial [Actinomycetota bacterium]|nr:ABC transporter substrate-binding protein [Actinomycetota bacterium]
MKYNRVLALWATLLVAVSLTVGCTSNKDNTGQTDEAGEKATGTITVGIDIPFHPLFDYLMSDPDKFFADSGYDVEFKVLDATTQVPAFGRGDLDVITTVPSFQPRIKQQYGIDTVYFYPLARWTPGPQLLVPPDSPITSIDELKGKKVAIAPLSGRFGAEEVATLAATGENITDFFDLQQTDAAAQQLSLGRVDAAWLEAPSTAPLLEEGYKPIFGVQDAFEDAFGDPAVMNGGFITSKDFADANPDFVKALSDVMTEAWDTFQSDPETVLNAASEVSGLPNEQLELVAQVLNLAETTEEQKKVTETDVNTWSELFPLLKESGFNEESP